MPPKATTFLAHKYMCMCISLCGSLLLVSFFSFFFASACVYVCLQLEKKCGFLWVVCVCVPRAAEVWLACVRDSSRRAVQKEKAAQQQQQQSEAGERRTRQNTPEHANIAQHSGVWWRRRAWAWGWGLFFFFFFGLFCLFWHSSNIVA